MAKKQLIEYYKVVEKQYLEMLSNVNDFNEALKSGEIEEEQYDSVMKQVLLIKQNYERLSYVMYLLNQPNRESKKDKYNKANKDLYNYLANANSEVVVKEDEDALKELKKQVKQAKKVVKASKKGNKSNGN